MITRNFPTYIKIYKIDIIIFLLFIVIATIPRLIFLQSIPLGLHGDEAWTGIDARMILSNGYIPVYVGSGLGQPTGPLYFTAFIFRLFDDSIFWLRFSMAMFGIITIPLFYVFLRQFFNYSASVLASLALCFSYIHIYYSRISFMLISAPVSQLLSLIFLVAAYKKERPLLFLASGAFAGIGTYTYNTFPIYIISLFIFLLIEIIFRKNRQHLLRNLVYFSSSFIIFSLPLLLFIVFNLDFYFAHHISISSIQGTSSNLYSFFETGAVKMFNFFNGYKVDWGDGFGQVESFGYTYILLAIIGIALIIVKPKRLPIFFIFSSLLVLTPLFVTIDGIYRRQILFLVFFYFFIGYFFNWIINKFAKYKLITISIIFVLICWVSTINIHNYFLKFPYTYDTEFVFPHAETQAAVVAGKINTNSTLLFFSSRWPCGYETVRFITQNAYCEDRSYEWGVFNLTPPSNTNVIYIFTNNYIEYYQDIYKEFPNGKYYEVKDPNNLKTVGIIYKI